MRIITLVGMLLLSSCSYQPFKHLQRFDNDGYTHYQGAVHVTMVFKGDSLIMLQVNTPFHAVYKGGELIYLKKDRYRILNREKQ
jgi:hypothetical protein